MYAVIETGGKQYRVEVGTELEVELLDAEPGKTVTVGRVLLVADGDEASIGRPVVDGAEVSAEIVRQGRGEKLIVFKYGPKTRRRVKNGHRQELTTLRISDITLNGKSAAKKAEKASSDAKTERQRVEEAAAAQAAKDAELAAKLAAGAKAPAKKTETKPRAKTAATTKPEPATKSDAEAKAKRAPAKRSATPSKAAAADKSTADKPAAKKPAAKKPAAKKPAAKKPAAKPRATKKDE